MKREDHATLFARIEGRLDEYRFIVNMLPGIRAEDWYKRRIRELESLRDRVAKEIKAKKNG